MEENQKFEGIPLASEMLSDLKRKIRMQQSIIFLQWLALLLWSLRSAYERKATWQKPPS